MRIQHQVINVAAKSLISTWPFLLESVKNGQCHSLYIFPSSTQRCISLSSSSLSPLLCSASAHLVMMAVFQDEVAKLISSDLTDLVAAAYKLAKHVMILGVSPFGVSFMASIAAIYLLILNHTYWKWMREIRTSLLIPYIFFSLPSCIFGIFRAEFGKWIALIAVVFRLFFPKNFPDWLELPSALILLIVVAPDRFANTFRSNAVGVAICLVIVWYVMKQYIQAWSELQAFYGRKETFNKSIVVGITLMFAYPISTLVQYIVWALIW